MALEPGCRVLESGLGAPSPVVDAQAGQDAVPLAADAPTDSGGETEVLHAFISPALAGCSDGSREGFRDVANWPAIAGCAGGFDRPGLLQAVSTCGLLAGDTSVNPNGSGCSAADLCAPQWHLCLGGADVAAHSSTGGCEGATSADESLFFAAAQGATTMGICLPERGADASSAPLCLADAGASTSNDLHGCGGLGEPESAACAPFSRRMGFADCLATQGVWKCGDASTPLCEAALVTKPDASLGGVLCCRD